MCGSCAGNCWLNINFRLRLLVEFQLSLTRVIPLNTHHPGITCTIPKMTGLMDAYTELHYMTLSYVVRSERKQILRKLKHKWNAGVGGDLRQETQKTKLDDGFAGDVCVRTKSISHIIPLEQEDT